MFTNLIESNLDKSGLKRRSSFFLATVVSYVLILFTAGVVGVLTYDAQVEAQTTEMLVLDFIPPVNPNREPETPRAVERVKRPRTPGAPVDQNLTESVRTKAVSTTDDPTRVPENVGVKASDVPPITGSFRIGNRNADRPPITPNTSGCATCPTDQPKVVETEKPPLPPTPPPKMLRVSPTIIASKVVSLPKPIYPALAKAARIQGPVNVQILIDENGKVISAQAVKGSPMLTQAAVDAARRARFTPTKLGNEAVKVQGVITYNFVLQ